MFDVLYSEKKLAEIGFTHPEKFRSIPSLALPAICALDEYLTKDMRVFEWGSGASTLFFAMRCKDFVSIENSPGWYDKVGLALTYRGMREDVTRIRVDAGEGFEPDFASYQPGLDTVNFRDYVKVIDREPDESFDVILVDGRARCACLEHAQPKLKPGGLLILDDSARSIYQYAMAKIDWPRMDLEGCIPFYRHGHTVRTTIWVKE